MAENEQRIGRAILKLSGELFSDPDRAVSFPQYDAVAKQLIEISSKTGVQLAVVVGGGNIFRGREAGSNVDHNEADDMGMLATIMNGIGLREALERNGDPSVRLMTAFSLPSIGELYIRHKGRHHLSEGRMVILAGGLGKPNFSTDSAVAQYADELLCEIILKASTVDGVYDSDPKLNKNAKKLVRISHNEAISKNLGIMDSTAFTMCRQSKIPIFVFNIKDLDKLPDILNGDFTFGTLITSSPSPDSLQP